MSRESTIANEQEGSHFLWRKSFRKLGEKWGGGKKVDEFLDRFFQNGAIRLEEKQAISAFILSPDSVGGLAIQMGLTRNGLYYRVYHGIGSIIKHLTERGQPLGDLDFFVGAGVTAERKVLPPEPAEQPSAIQGIIEKLGGSTKLQGRISVEKEFAKEAGSKFMGLLANVMERFIQGDEDEDIIRDVRKLEFNMSAERAKVLIRNAIDYFLLFSAPEVGE